MNITAVDGDVRAVLSAAEVMDNFGNVLLTYTALTIDQNRDIRWRDMRGNFQCTNEQRRLTNDTESMFDAL